MCLHLFRREEVSEIGSGGEQTEREREREKVVVSVSLEDDRLNRNICTLAADHSAVKERESTTS